MELWSNYSPIPPVMRITFGEKTTNAVTLWHWTVDGAPPLRDRGHGIDGNRREGKQEVDDNGLLRRLELPISDNGDGDLNADHTTPL